VLDDVARDEPGLGDLDAWAQELHDAVAGFGPLQRLFDDPEVEEIWFNEPSRVFAARRGRSELTTVVLTEEQVHDLVERMLRTSGRRVDVSQPFVDALLPDGSRLHVVIPDVTRRHWAVNVRRHVLAAARLDDLVALGTLTSPVAEFLVSSVVAGLNIVVAGGTQAGKTTLLGCLLNAVPARERVVTCEEVFELRLDRPDWVAMQTRTAGLEGTGEISLRRLVVEALRMRPHRLVVGEVRQAEALDLLVALNSGMPGMTSVHANSARDAVSKLCVLPLLAGENVTASYVVPTVASSVDLVVHAATRADGQRRVREVLAVSGRVEDGVVETAEVFTTRDGELVRGNGFPPHQERFEAHGIDVAALLGHRRDGR
jgi:pilus assembly protein CpaF